jgi:hypothetical protein
MNPNIIVNGFPLDSILIGYDEEGNPIYIDARTI